MTQSFDLNKMGISAMSEFEMRETDGGNFWTWLAAGIACVVGVGLIIGSAGLVLGASIGLVTMAGLAMNGVFEE
ncbi:MAG: hypothetical protein H7Z13_01515 [Ferruginibacter sp.]|nr:hypothetical protein [Ferruginibacter sp.]